MICSIFKASNFSVLKNWLKFYSSTLFISSLWNLSFSIVLDSQFNFGHFLAWLRVTDEGSIAEICIFVLFCFEICSILLILSDFRMINPWKSKSGFCLFISFLLLYISIIWYIPSLWPISSITLGHIWKYGYTNLIICQRKHRLHLLASYKVHLVKEGNKIYSLHVSFATAHNMRPQVSIAQC